jgi:hypothetical protein
MKGVGRNPKGDENYKSEQQAFFYNFSANQKQK